MKIKSFNKGNLKVLRSEIDSALKEVGEKYGVDLSAGGGSYTYTQHEVTFKLKVSVLDASGESVQGRDDFILYGMLKGFDEDDFGRTFTTDDGKTFKITGWNRRRRKYPVEVTRQDAGHVGDIWFFSVNAVLRYLGKADRIRPSFSIR